MDDPSTNGSFVPSDHTTQPPQTDLSSSGVTIPSDSENYSSATNNHDLSVSPSPPPSSSESPIIIYKPPTLWGLLRGAAINLLLPFVNGLMLGLGELLAHEAAFRLGWGGTKVRISHLLCTGNSSHMSASNASPHPETILVLSGALLIGHSSGIPTPSFLPTRRPRYRDTRRSARKTKKGRRRHR